jgi:hypothetical protein
VDVNLLGDYHRLNENTESLLEASEEVGLEINEEKTKYIVMSRHQNTGQNHDRTTANKPWKVWDSSDILKP